jgi:hypothetical protein
VDSEVAAWLEKAANEDANRINWILKREAKRNRKVPVPSSSLLDKAS